MSLTVAQTGYKPRHYQWAYDAWYKQNTIHWMADEVNFADDLKDYATLKPEEKSLIDNILCFFTQADCFDSQTEILTHNGFKFFKDLKQGDLVAQVTSEQKIEFVSPLNYIIKPYKGVMKRFNADLVPVDFVVTPNHNVIYDYKGVEKIEKADSVKLYQRKKLYSTGIEKKGKTNTVTPLERLKIAFQADGNFKKGVNGSKLGFLPHRFGFKKTRKINRLRDILNNCNINYTEQAYQTPNGEYTEFYVEMQEAMEKDFSWVNLQDISSNWAIEFLEELLEWDGHRPKEGNPSYVNTNFLAASKVHAIACIAGLSSRLSVHVDNRSEKFSDTYEVYIDFDINNRLLDCQHVKKTNVEYDDFVYCVEVPSHKIIVRRNGRSVVSGNCDIAGAYKTHFMPHFKNHEVGMMLSAFTAMEGGHIDAYAKLIDTLGMGDKTFSAFVEYKEMKDKHDYFDKFSMNKPHKVAQALAAFSAFGEGLQLFASFAMLLNFQRFNKMKGMGQIVTWSIRDETLHVESMIKLFKEYIEEYSHFIDLKLLEKDIRIICDEVISHEDKFIDLAFELGDIEGLTSGEMKQYIRYIAGKRLEQLGYTHDFPVKNPLTWIEEILGLNEHANFFETRATEYTKASTQGSWEDAYDD